MEVFNHLAAMENMLGKLSENQEASEDATFRRNQACYIILRIMPGYSDDGLGQPDQCLIS